MKRFVAYIILIIFIAIYIISSSDPLIKIIAQAKYLSESFWASDKYRYGDLYGFTYLPKFRKKLAPVNINKPNCDGKGSIHLYALCDSYLWTHMNKPEYFCNVSSFKYMRLNREFRETMNVALDSSFKNVLLIEMAERNVLDLMENDSTYLMSFISSNYQTGEKLIKPFTLKDESLKTKLRCLAFNNAISTNFEFMVWDTKIFTPIKELKAAINYNLFDKVEGNNGISSNKNYIFCFNNIDTSISSSFKKIPDSKINSSVQIFNSMYAHYKSMGFDAIYISIIPNTVSVVEPNFKGFQYNQLASRIQHHPALKVPVIDIFPAFSSASKPVFYSSDTHWNEYGISLWLDKFNTELKFISSSTQKK